MQAGKGAFEGWPRPRRVTLEAPPPPGENRDATYGDPQPAWGPVAEVWASVKPLSGREAMLAQQLQPDVTHAVRLRYRAGVGPECRLVLKGRKLNVVSVLNVEERDRSLELLCIEQVD